MTNGKGSKNRLRGDGLKAYGESKLWGNLKKKKEADLNMEEYGARCLNCMDTGIMRCDNPDHGLIAALSFTDMGRLGCPCCDGTGKTPVDEECDKCDIFKKNEAQK